MKLIKILFLFAGLIFFNGCIQTITLLGPGLTVATTGNIMHEGFQYGANTAIKNETGKDTLEHLKDAVENDDENKNLRLKFTELAEHNIQNVKKKLSKD